MVAKKGKLTNAENALFHVVKLYQIKLLEIGIEILQNFAISSL